MSYLVLVRHGESRWNRQNRFTGWVDVPLSAKGIREAQFSARQLKKIDFDVAFTSRLERAHATLLIILSLQDRTGVFQHAENGSHYRWKCRSNHCHVDEIPIFESETLNERYYGKLQGLYKSEAVKIYGKERVLKWRRGYASRPPGGESLKEALERVAPYFRKNIMSRLKKGKNVLLSGHGNTLRGVVKHLEHISDENIPFLDLPEGKPIIYRYTRGTCVCLTPELYRYDRPLR